MNETVETERRLTETLRAVGDQTDASGMRGFDRIQEDLAGAPSFGFGLDVGSRRNVTWLAAAAVIIALLAAGILYRAGETGGENLGPADEDLRVVEADLSDDRLYLLPPLGTDLSSGVLFQDDPTEDDGVGIIVARKTATGFDQSAMIARTADPSFGASRRPVTIAGRELFEASYLEQEDLFFWSAAEQMPGGFWIEYTTAAGPDVLAEVVAATTVDGDGIAFAPTSSGIEQQGEPFAMETIEGTVLTHPDPLTLDPDRSDPDFNLVIIQEASDLGVLLFSSVIGSVTEAEINGRPGYQFDPYPFRPDEQGPQTAVSWEHESGHTVMLLASMDEQQADEFIAGLRDVDRETWLKELTEINRAAGTDNRQSGVQVWSGRYSSLRRRSG